MSSLEKCLFRSSTHFLIVLYIYVCVCVCVCVCVLSCMRYFYILDIIPCLMSAA